MINETELLPTRDIGEPHSFGIELHRGTIPVLPQAVGGLLTQALYKAYLELGPTPLTFNKLFQHNYAEQMTTRMCFDVDLEVTGEENLSGLLMLTNRRIALVLSLMGFDFSHQEDLQYLKEYKFDIVVEIGNNRTVIGHGSLKNSQRANSPVLAGTRLITPHCSGASAASRRSIGR